MSLQERQPTVRVYRGITDQGVLRRGIETYNKGFNYERLNPYASVDAFIAGQLQRVLSEGRESVNGRITVTIVDLGSEGAALLDFLSDESYGVESRKILQEHPELSLRLVAVRDAESEEEFLQPKALQSARRQGQSLDNSQITAELIPYSVTTNQSILLLANALEERTGEKIDGVLAFGFLSHLKPTVFDQAIRDIAAVLSSGGEMVAFEYATVSGSRLSVDDDRQPEVDEPVFLRGTDGETISTVDLRKEAEALLTQESSAENEEAIYNLAVRINQLILLNNVSKFADILDFVAAYPRTFNPRQDLEHVTLQHVLTDAEAVIREKKMREIKGAILTHLQQELAPIASLTYGQHTILLRKNAH